jgi:hypothetical protein
MQSHKVVLSILFAASLMLAGCRSNTTIPNQAGTSGTTQPSAPGNTSNSWKPGDDWREDQCKDEKDDEGQSLNVCKANYDGDKVFIGLYWSDGKAELAGSCESPKDFYVKGLSPDEVKLWQKEVCSR